MAYYSLTCNKCGYKYTVHFSMDFDLLPREKQKAIYEEMQRNEICRDCIEETEEEAGGNENEI